MTELFSEVSMKQHDIEHLFCGTTLVNGDYARKEAGWLSPETFTDEVLAKYWARVRQGEDASAVAIDLGVFTELTKWMNRSTNYMELPAYARAIQAQNYKRQMVLGAQDIIKSIEQGTDEDIPAILDVLRQQDNGSSRTMRDPREVADNLMYRVERGDISIPFGIDSVDYATGGMERGTFTVLAGRTSMGKSSLAFQFAEHQALVHGLRVGFFALEMSAEQMFARRLCHKVYNRSGNRATWQDVRSGQVAPEEIERLRTYVNEYADKIDGKLYVSDATNVTSADIVRTQLREKYDVIYVDHVRLLKDKQWKSERYDQYIGRVTLSMHELAKNTNSVVVGLFQLNREVEGRPDHRPLLKDLRDSGQIEENADNVILIYRPGYYTGEYADPDETELVLAKYRDGSRSSNCWVGFHLKEQRFDSLYKKQAEQVIEDGLTQAKLPEDNNVPF